MVKLTIYTCYIILFRQINTTVQTQVGSHPDRLVKKTNISVSLAQLVWTMHKLCLVKIAIADDLWLIAYS